MRTLAEEKKEGTFELLATKPLTDWDIILGKYLAAVTLVLFALIPTLIYYISVYQLGATVGNIDSGAVIGSYIGLFLLGAAFVAIGIFSSSLTKNQIIAFAIAVFLCFITFSGFDSASQILSFQSIDSILINLGINAHYQSISRGVLDTRDLIYFLSFITIFLAITKTILGGRKW
jgi:ABC-2 type transport system permease protein